jgi:high-affinity iron transporter
LIILTSFLLSLREGVEAALIIGIVLSALRQLGRADCARIVWSAIGSSASVPLGIKLKPARRAPTPA